MNMGTLKALALGAGALLAWGWLFESFVLKGPDGKGFIERGEGFGVDDVFNALGGAGTMLLLKRLL